MLFPIWNLQENNSKASKDWALAFYWTKLKKEEINIFQNKWKRYQYYELIIHTLWCFCTAKKVGSGLRSLLKTTLVNHLTLGDVSSMRLMGTSSKAIWKGHSRWTKCTYTQKKHVNCSAFNIKHKLYSQAHIELSLRFKFIYYKNDITHNHLLPFVPHCMYARKRINLSPNKPFHRLLNLKCGCLTKLRLFPSTKMACVPKRNRASCFNAWHV